MYRKLVRAVASFLINNTRLSAQIAIQSAIQPSTYKTSVASRAIDGNVGTISHTADNGIKPHWLELDLGQEYAITKVTAVVNRWTGYCNRINGLVVHLLNGATETERSAALCP